MAEVPKFLQHAPSSEPTADEVVAHIERVAPAAPPPHVLARACELLRAQASAPSDRQLAAAVLAYEHAIPETERPTAAQRVKAMHAALTAAMREV